MGLTSLILEMILGVALNVFVMILILLVCVQDLCMSGVSDMKESDKAFIEGIIFGVAIIIFLSFGFRILAAIGNTQKVPWYTYRILEQEGNCKDVCFGHYQNNTPTQYDLFNPLKQTRNDEKGEHFCGVSRYGLLYQNTITYCFCEFEQGNCYS